MIGWLIYGIPWWAQVAILAVPVILAFYVAVRVFGWDRVKLWIAPALVILAAFGFAQKNKQQGYLDRRAEEEKALDHAEEIVEHEQTEVKRLPDVELDQKVDKWTRP